MREILAATTAFFVFCLAAQYALLQGKHLRETSDYGENSAALHWERGVLHTPADMSKQDAGVEHPLVREPHKKSNLLKLKALERKFEARDNRNDEPSVLPCANIR